MTIEEKLKELEDKYNQNLEVFFKMINSGDELISEKTMKVLMELKLLRFAISQIIEIKGNDDYVFDVDDYVQKSTNDSTFKTMGYVLQEIQRKILTKIINIRNTKNARVIVTTGKLAAFLQDMAGYTLEPLQGRIKEQLDAKEKPYPMGQISDILVNVDPFMKWTDNRIRFYVDNDFAPDKEVCYLKIKDTNDYLI